MLVQEEEETFQGLVLVDQLLSVSVQQVPQFHNAERHKGQLVAGFFDQSVAHHCRPGIDAQNDPLFLCCYLHGTILVILSGFKLAGIILYSPGYTIFV